MGALIQLSREPKTLELEETDDGRFRLVVTVRKLGAVTSVEYFLDHAEAESLSRALSK